MLHDISFDAHVKSENDVRLIASISNDAIFDTHTNSEISMRLNASILSDSSVDPHVDYDLDTSNYMNSSNDMELNATILNEHTYSMSDNTLSIKVVCINVCGLLSKLRYPEFEEFCQSYDIVCKLGSLDSFDIHNFEVQHLLNRNNPNQDLMELLSWLRIPFLNMLRF